MQRQIAADDKLNHKLFTPKTPGGLAPVEDPLHVLNYKPTKPKVAGLSSKQTLPEQMTSSELAGWGWKKEKSASGATVYKKGRNTLSVNNDGQATYTNTSTGHEIKQHVAITDHKVAAPPAGHVSGTGIFKVPTNNPVKHHEPKHAGAGFAADTNAKAAHGLGMAQTVHTTKTVTVPVEHTVTSYVKVPDQRSVTPGSAHDDLMAKVHHGEGMEKQEQQTYHTEKRTTTYTTYETKTVPETYTVPAGASAPTSTTSYAPAPPPPSPEGSSARPSDWHAHTASQLEDRRTGQTVVVDGKTYKDATVNTFKDGTSTFQEHGKTIGYDGAGKPDSPASAVSVDRSSGSPTVSVKLEHHQNNQGLSAAANAQSSADVQDARASAHPTYTGKAVVKETSYLKNGDTLTTTASGAEIETTQDGHSYTVKKAPEQKTAEINNGSPMGTDAHDRYAPAYTGGAKPVKVEHLKNGATLTTTASGAEIETTASGHSYTVKKAPAHATSYNPNYDVGGNMVTPDPQPQNDQTQTPAATATSTDAGDLNQRGLAHSSASTPTTQVSTPEQPAAAVNNSYDVGGNMVTPGAQPQNDQTETPAASPAAAGQTAAIDSTAADPGDLDQRGLIHPTNHTPESAAATPSSDPSLAANNSYDVGGSQVTPSPVYTDAHDRLAGAYTGGAQPVKVEHLKNGATLTTTATGAEIETTAAGNSYTVKKAKHAAAVPTSTDDTPSATATITSGFGTDGTNDMSQPNRGAAADWQKQDTPATPAPETPAPAANNSYDVGGAMVTPTVITPTATPTPPATPAPDTSDPVADDSPQRGLAQTADPAPVPAASSDTTVTPPADKLGLLKRARARYHSVTDNNDSSPVSADNLDETTKTPPASGAFVNSIKPNVDIKPSITLPPTSLSTNPVPGLSSLNLSSVADPTASAPGHIRPGSQL